LFWGKGIVRYEFRPSSPLSPLAVTLALQVKHAEVGMPGAVGQEVSAQAHVAVEGLNDLLKETWSRVSSTGSQRRAVRDAESAA
jgi:hypothetical protein